MNVICDCKEKKIGRRVGKTSGWLCSHNNLTAVCPKVLNFWSDQNTEMPENLTQASMKKCHLKCGDSNCYGVKEIQIGNLTKRKKFKCPKCKKVWHLIQLCDCKERGIGKLVNRLWLCIHTSLDAKCININDFWSDKNELKPSEILAVSQFKVFINCKKCGDQNDKFPSQFSKVYECNNCYILDNNVAKLFPHLLKEVNDKTDLSTLTPGSHQIINWKCLVCLHTWDAELATRTKQGSICPACTDHVKITYTEFVIRAKKIHNGKYIYNEVWIDFEMRNKIEIICPKHGQFNQTAASHVRGIGCSDCAGNTKLSYKDFLEKVKSKHGGYKYPNEEPTNFSTKIKIDIECLIHGIFSQNVGKHLQGQGCSKCTGNAKVSYLEFLERANAKHGQYKYPAKEPPKFSTKIKIDIECLIHGIFPQRVEKHLQGQGCQLCGKCFSKGNEEIAKILTNIGKTFKREKGFLDLKYINFLYYDFGEISDDSNKLLDYDGVQHFEDKAWSKTGGLTTRMARDIVKDQYAIDNGYSLLRIPYTMKSELSEIVNDYLELDSTEQYIFTYEHYAVHLNFDPNKIIYMPVESPPIKW